MSKKCYVPVVKWKKGEEEALKQLSDEHKNSIIPLIEITDYQEPDLILEHLNSSYGNAVYIDTMIAAEDDREYLISIVDEFKKKGTKVFPVLYFDDLDYIAEDLFEICNRVAIRVSVPEDIDGPDYTDIFESIKEIKENSNIKIDIILNMGIITKKEDANRQYSELKHILLNYLVNEDYYNSLIICSTAFPDNLSNVEAGEEAEFNRYDIKIFKKILAQEEVSSIKSKIKYSDYGVTKFTETELDFSKMRNGVLPKIKYTIDEKYVVLKGKRKKHSKELEISYIDLSNEIISSKYYYGKDFSFGDLDIYERANGLNKKGPGGNTNWVTISANHHIAVVVEQLSKIL